MKALIINFNRLSLTSKLADWCATHGLETIIVDNNSDYPPLLEYYNSCPHKVVRLYKNFGHKVLTEGTELRKALNVSGQHIITDPDLDLTGIPRDFLDVLKEGLNRYPQFHKCGFSLELDDLPDSPEGRFVRKNEAHYWCNPLDDMYFNAAIDTTFALYDMIREKHFLPAIRTNKPYTAKHLSWYYKDLDSLSEDENYYYQTANKSASGKERLMP